MKNKSEYNISINHKLICKKIYYQKIAAAKQKLSWLFIENIYLMCCW